MKNILLGVFALLTFIPFISNAHTRWFATGELEPYVTTEPTSLYLAVWGSIIVLVLMTAYFLQKCQWLDLEFLRPTTPHSFDRAASAFAMIVGTFFLIAGTHEYFLTPNLSMHDGFPAWLIYIEIAVGLALITGIGTRIAALTLLAAWILSFQYSGLVEGFENVWIVSTTLFIAIMGNDYFSLYSNSFLRTHLVKFKHYALAGLRIGTGLTLMVLGLSEKILAPEFGINFLQQYNWNFMQMLGFPYSDYLFTISAGSVEFLLGALLVSGLLTRLTTLVTAVIFTLPLFILGPIELAGHLPHFVALVLILLYGHGNHFLPLRHCKKKRC